MYEFENSGKNVEKTIEDGLNKLGLSKGTVDVKVLETGGFFKKARVLFFIPDEVYDSSEEVQKQVKLYNLEKRAVQESQQQAQEKELAKKLRNATKNEKKDKNEKITEEEKSEKAAILSTTTEKKNEKKTENLKEDKEEINGTLETGNLIKSQVESEAEIIDDAEQGNEEQISQSGQFKVCTDFLKGFLKIAKIDANVAGRENPQEIFIDVEGRNLHNLIGFKGQGLNALQLILSALCSKSRSHKKVRLDIDGYRRKRKVSLEGLANRMAKRVLETQEKVYLQPMSAYERRVVHNIIQKYPELESHSAGEEPHRILTIDKKKEEDK
ncbi:MAG: KH domain-containing protein [Clostridia bacterium]|nr:KH domain-containing protein [Clostridia bacterium]